MPDQVQVVVTANLDALKQGMADAANSVRAGAEQMKDSVGGLSDVFDNLHETVMGLIETFGAYEGLKFGVELVKSGAEMSEQLVVLSKQTGINLEDLSRLKFAAQSTGSDFDRLGTMIGTLDQKLLQLHSSTSTTITAGFQQLGIDPNKLKGTSDALDKISEALRRMGSTPQSIGALREILGRQGAADIPMLVELKELEKESDRLGGTLDSKTVEAAWHAQEAFNTLGAVWDAAKIRISGALAPAIETLAVSLQSLVQEIDKLSRSGEINEWAENAVAAMGHIFRGIVAVSQAFEGFQDLMRGSAASSGILGKPGESKEQLQKRIDEITQLRNKAGAGLSPEELATGIGGDTKKQDLVGYYDNQIAELEKLKTTASPAAMLVDQGGMIEAAGKTAFQPWVENALAAAQAAAKLKQEIAQDFAEAQAQSKLEAAQAGNTADAKVEAARRVFLAAQTFFGQGSRQAQAAETSLYEAESARDKQNQAATGQGLIDTEKYGAGGEGQVSAARATTQQQLALKVIDPEQAATAEKDQDDQIYSLREALYAKLADLYQNDPKELARVHAEEEQEDAQHSTKLIQDATKIAVANETAATDMADAWRGALEPLMSTFDSFFDVIVRGTNGAKNGAEQLRLELQKLERSTLLDLAKSGMKGMMFGGKEGTTQALFGGGMVGEASKLAMGTGTGGNGGILAWLLGPATANSMMNAMKGTAGGGLIGWLFGTAESAIMSAMGMAPGGAAGAAAPATKPAAPTAAGTAASAVGGASQGVSVVNGLTTLGNNLKGPLATMVSHLENLNVTSLAMKVGQELQTGYLDAIAAYNAIETVLDTYIAGNAFKVLGTGAQGGIIPSAFGGMVVTSNLGGGASLNILHPNEMVLPRYLSEGFQRMLGQGGDSGGGDIHTHFHVTAMDAKSVSDFFDRNGDNIARSIHKSVRNQNPIMHAAIRMGAR